jgi:phosphoribosyl-ATP pyrophosphohydrolase
MKERQYLLGKIMEECGEVIHAAAKGQLFGLDDINPDTGEANFSALKREFSDLVFYMESVFGRDEIASLVDGIDREKRNAKLEKWMGYSRARGLTSDG